MTNPQIVLEAGVRAHCRRVAAWSRELAAALALSPTEQRLVEQTALHHHTSDLLLDDAARQSLLKDLKLKEAAGESPIPEEIRALVQVFRGRRCIDDPILAKLIALLEISDEFDQFFEAEPYFGSEAMNSSVEAMLSYLQVSSRADVSRVIDRLPVFPRAAREVVKFASNPEVTVGRLESAALLDPVLSGLLITTANSAYYSPRSVIARVAHAITYIGLETARKVLLAAAFRGNFGSLRMHQLWNHSLDVAHTAERLAHDSALDIDPSEAFLAGLVHDIGRLAFSMMPAAFLNRFDRLTGAGCPPIAVEMCLSGLCHGEAGAETLVQWKFPEAIVDAVRWHHRPERSSHSLPSLIYVAEFLNGSEEDLPSYVRLNTACRQAGIEWAAVTKAGRATSDYLQSLRFAA